MLLLKNGRHRLSIDIDIICPPGTDIEDYLNAYKDFGFIDYKPIERIQRGTDIPKTHSKFFYQVAFIDDSDRQESRGTAIWYWGFSPLNFRENPPPNRNNLF